MHLYDTATRSLRELPVQQPDVSLYVCGITPYDAAHLGHAFVYHVFDVVTRRLRARGQRVRSVRNITDVDDDIFRVSRERQVDPHELVDEQVRRFDTEMAAIDIGAVDAAPRASAHVPEMIGWIARLQDAGAAYEEAGWVYFDTASVASYGSLSGLDRDTMLRLSAERGGNPADPRKRDPLDFVLWQPSLPGEDRWTSPWGAGRPGWHIECSVLASRLLGTPIDLHGGGSDLVFPHHECELAQAEAHGETPFARHWMHVAMVRHEGEKMSKSLGNLVFVRDLLASVPPATVRIMLAQHHWRQGWEFSMDDLRAADARRRMYLDAVESGGLVDPEQAQHHRDLFFERLDDDLDTPGALEVVDAAAVQVNHHGRVAPAAAGEDGAALLGSMLGVLGARAGATVPAPLP